MFKYFHIVLITYLVVILTKGEDIEVCLPSWSIKLGTQSSDGNFIGTKPLMECLTHCEMDEVCLAVDFNQTDNACWSHSDPDYDSIERTYENIETSQYKLNRSCDTIKPLIEDCPSSWKSLTGKSSTSNYITNGFANLSSCFTYCRFTNSCNGIVFDNSTWPFCKLFTDVNFFNPEHLSEKSSSVIYYFNKKECYENRYTKIYARCVGQTFPEVSQWCPSGTYINIESMNFTDNPFCCENDKHNNIPPLYNDLLPSVRIEYVRETYSQNIGVCISNSSCVLKAETDGFKLITHVCPIDGPNSVAIMFTCIVDTINIGTTTLSPTDSTSFAIYSFITNSSTSVTQPSLHMISSTLLPSSSTLSSADGDMAATTKYDNSIFTSSSFKIKGSSSLTTANDFIPPTSLQIQYFSTPMSFSFPLSSSLSLLPSDDHSESSPHFNPPTSPEILLPSNPSSPISSLKSSALYSTVNPESPEKYENKRTALVLGALGVTFGLLSLILIILLLIIYLRGNEKVMNKVSNLSWKTLHGTSSA